MSDQTDTSAPVADTLPEGDEPRLPTRSGGIFGAAGAVDRAKRAVEREKAVEATSALFDQDADGAGVDDSTPEPEAPVEEPAEPASDDPKPTEVILTRMAEISADPDGMDTQLRNSKLREIQTNIGLLPDAELGGFCAFVVANNGQFEQRTAHYVVKLLLARHPKVVEHAPPLPGNIIGGIARRVIEGEYTWDNLVIRPPRPKSEPPAEEPTASGAGDEGGDGQASNEEEPPAPEPVPGTDEDPILTELRRQNAELAALGF